MCNREQHRVINAFVPTAAMWSIYFLSDTEELYIEPVVAIAITQDEDARIGLENMCCDREGDFQIARFDNNFLGFSFHEELHPADWITEINIYKAERGARNGTGK
jgi:hypothetical protein